MTFDPTRRLVMASFKTVLGHDLPAGTPLVLKDKPEAFAEVDEPVARRLWDAKLAVYMEDARPTPVETPRQEAERLVGREFLGGGWWAITAPWLDEPIKVQGADAAQEEYDRVVSEGRPETPVVENSNKSDTENALAERADAGKAATTAADGSAAVAPADEE